MLNCRRPLHERLVLNTYLPVLVAQCPLPQEAAYCSTPLLPLLPLTSCVFHVLHLAPYKRSLAFISMTPLDCERPAALFYLRLY